MRIVMLATGPFALPTFRGLFKTHHEVAALVTAPTGRTRGARPAPIAPVRDLAHEQGVPVLDPEDINSPLAQEQLRKLEVDLLVTCDYGQILSATTLATARLGGINLHASLLPKYRGAAPINWAIYHGETETGVTVIHMTPQVDAGPCIAQVRTAIDPNETAPELEARLAEMGAWLVRRALDAVEAGRLEALPQDPSQASKAPRLKKEDGIIDWSRPATAIFNQVRAMQPWPKTFTFWPREGRETLRLIVERAAVEDAQSPCPEPPGTVLAAEGDRLVVACEPGRLALRAVQPAGKRLLSADEFLRGYRVRPGDRFTAGLGAAGRDPL